MPIVRVISAGLVPVLVTAVTACATSGTTTTTPPKVQEAGRSGFVLYTEVGTWILPTDPRVPVARGCGLSMLDDTRRPGRVTWFEARPGACDSASEPEAQTETEAEPGESEGEGECEDGTTTPWSLVGGRLYEGTDTHTTCDGLNIYGYFAGPRELVAGPWNDRAVFAGAPAWCEADHFGGGSLAVWPPDLSSQSLCRRTSQGWRWPSGENPSVCGDCDVDDSIVFLRSGLLIRVADRQYSAGGGPRVVEAVAVHLGNCPSAADPCGSASAFAHVPLITAPTIDADAPDFDGASEWWVATDTSHAFVVTPAGWELWSRGDHAAPVRKGAAFGRRILGVRYHQDVSGLLARDGLERVP